MLLALGIVLGELETQELEDMAEFLAPPPQTVKFSVFLRLAWAIGMETQWRREHWRAANC